MIGQKRCKQQINHLVFTSLVTSNVKPSTSQYGGRLPIHCSYFIPFIPYLGSGDNFTIIPQYGTHSFTPTTTTLLIGSGSANYTETRFLQINLHLMLAW